MPRTSSSPPPTLSLRAKLLWIIGLVALARWPKGLAVDHVKDHAPRIYFGDFFRLEYAENPGAFLSLGAQLSADTRFWVFAVAVGAFLIAAGWVLFRERKLDVTTAFSLSVIVGGGIGNLIDRATRANHGVVDFLNLGLGNFRTGIFNIADMAIMLGVILLAWKSFRRVETESPAKAV